MKSKILSSYFFHYVDNDSITYLCLTDAIFPKKTAYQFLNDLKSLFES